MDSLTLLSVVDITITAEKAPAFLAMCRIHAVCLLVPEGNLDRRVHVQKKNFKFRQTELQHWPLLRQSSQSAVPSVATARVSSTEEQTAVNQNHSRSRSGCIRVG